MHSVLRRCPHFRDSFVFLRSWNYALLKEVHSFVHVMRDVLIKGGVLVKGGVLICVCPFRGGSTALPRLRWVCVLHRSDLT